MCLDQINVNGNCYVLIARRLRLWLICRTRQRSEMTWRDQIRAELSARRCRVELASPCACQEQPRMQQARRSEDVINVSCLNVLPDIRFGDEDRYVALYVRQDGPPSCRAMVVDHPSSRFAERCTASRCRFDRMRSTSALAQRSARAEALPGSLLPTCVDQ